MSNAKSKELLLSIQDERLKRVEERLKALEDERVSNDDRTTSNVLQLNVGGRTDITVSRRLLTFFEDSVLAASFSGRWDESLERDQDGNIFVDQDPDVFLELIKYLRMKSNCNGMEGDEDMIVSSPDPSAPMDNMLCYYGLLHHVYPYEIVLMELPKETDVPEGSTTEITKSPDGFTTIVRSSSVRTVGVFPAAGHSRSVRSFTLYTTSNHQRLQFGWLPKDTQGSEMSSYASRMRTSSTPDGNVGVDCVSHRLLKITRPGLELQPDETFPSGCTIKVQYDGLKTWWWTVHDDESGDFLYTSRRHLVYPTSPGYEMEEIWPHVSVEGEVRISDIRWSP